MLKLEHLEHLEHVINPLPQHDSCKSRTSLKKAPPPVGPQCRRLPVPGQTPPRESAPAQPVPRVDTSRKRTTKQFAAYNTLKTTSRHLVARSPYADRLAASAPRCAVPPLPRDGATQRQRSSLLPSGIERHPTVNPDPFEESLIMADYQQSSVIGPQPRFDGFNRIDIQMIRRLIQNE